MKKSFQFCVKSLLIIFALSVLIIGVKNVIYYFQGFDFSSELKPFDDTATQVFCLNDNTIATSVLGSSVSFYDANTFEFKKTIKNLSGLDVEKYDDNKIVFYEVTKINNPIDKKDIYRRIIKVVDVNTEQVYLQSVPLNEGYIRYLGNNLFVLMERMKDKSEYVIKVFDLKNNRFLEDKTLVFSPINPIYYVNSIEKINDNEVIFFGPYKNMKKIFLTKYNIVDNKVYDIEIPDGKYENIDKSILKIGENKMLLQYNVNPNKYTSDFLIIDTKNLTSQKVECFQNDNSYYRKMRCLNLKDGRFLLYGSEACPNGMFYVTCRNIYIFDPKTNTVKHGNKKLKKGRYLSPALELPDGRIVIFGNDVDISDFVKSFFGLKKSVNYTMEIIKIND